MPEEIASVYDLPVIKCLEELLRVQRGEGIKNKCCEHL